MSKQQVRKVQTRDDDSLVHVMMVDDSRWDAELVEEYFQRMPSLSVRFRNCVSHRRAEELIQRNRPDGILLDVQFQHDPAGFEVLKQLREKPYHIPVVVMTTFERQEIAIRALRLGADDFLCKRDLTRNTLEFAIRTALQTSGDSQTPRIDPVTGLFQKNYLIKNMRRVLNVPGDETKQYSLMLFALDYLGDVTVGKSGGGHEELLKEMGGIFRVSMEEPHKIATRFGDEEFAVLICGAGQKEVFQYLKFLMTEWEDRVAQHVEGDTERYTCSAGISLLRKEHAGMKLPYPMIRSAEDALAKARLSSGHSYITVYE